MNWMLIMDKNGLVLLLASAILWLRVFSSAISGSSVGDSGILYANCISNGTIQIEFVCDDKKDCDDGSDEANCNQGRGTVSVTCRSNETILHFRVCDGKPDCKDGSDELDCRTEILRTNFLLVADEGQRNIFQVNLTTGDIRPVYPVKASPKIYPKTIDYIPAKRTLYYLSQKKSTECHIIIQTIDGGQPEIIPCPNVGADIQVVTSAVNNEKYTHIYSPVSRGNIVRLPLRPNATSDLKLFTVAEGSTLKALTFNVERSVLYWSVCDTPNLRIDKARNGMFDTHETVVRNLRSCTTAIAIDSSGEVIYWGEESGDLRMANLNGSNQTLMHRNPLASYVGLALDNDFLYISDSNSRCIQQLDRNTSIVTNLTGPVFVTPGNISIHSSHYMYQENQEPTQRANVGEFGTVWIVVVCFSIIVIVLTSVIFILRMKRKTRTTTEYEPNLPTPYVYDGHYDTIGPDSKEEVYEDIKESDHYDAIIEDDTVPQIQSEYLPLSDTCKAMKSEYLLLSDTCEDMKSEYLHLSDTCEPMKSEYLLISDTSGAMKSECLHISDTPETKTP